MTKLGKSKTDPTNSIKTSTPFGRLIVDGVTNLISKCRKQIAIVTYVVRSTEI